MKKQTFIDDSHPRLCASDVSLLFFFPPAFSLYLSFSLYISLVMGVSVVHLTDVNECEDPSYCRNGRCVNTPGSFHCICTQPLTFSAALKQCVYDGGYHK